MQEALLRWMVGKLAQWWGNLAFFTTNAGNGVTSESSLCRGILSTLMAFILIFPCSLMPRAVRWDWRAKRSRFWRQLTAAPRCWSCAQSPAMRSLPTGALPAPSCWGAPQQLVPPLSACRAGQRHPLAAPGGTVSLQTVPSRAKAAGLPRTRVGPRRVVRFGLRGAGGSKEGAHRGALMDAPGPHRLFGTPCVAVAVEAGLSPTNSWPKWDSHPAAVSPLRSTEHPRLHLARHSLV